MKRAILALALVAGVAFAQVPGRSARLLIPPTGGGGASASLAPAATGTDLTLTPGPLKAGGAGISTDGGIVITGATASGIAIRTLVGNTGNGECLISNGNANITGICQHSTGAGLNIYANTNIGLSIAATGALSTAKIFTSTVAAGNAAIQLATDQRICFGAAETRCISDTTKYRGIATIGGGGTVTVTVEAGARCVCSYSTVGAIIPLCNVSGTTLTITGTIGADMAYDCF